MPEKNERALIFDERIFYGSSQHYMHFLWGYLLPALHVMSSCPHRASVRFVIASCGPVMDRVTAEVLEALPFDAVIRDAGALEGLADSVVVPRWDVLLLRSFLAGSARPDCEMTVRMRDAVRSNPPYLDWLQRHTPEQLGQHVQAVRTLLASALDTTGAAAQDASYAGKMLILDRSPEPAFYASGKGMAEIPGYGRSRRALRGIEVAREQLSRHGVEVAIFEPGRHDMRTQMRAFGSCLGMIGIKGAEFANLVWLPTGSTVVLVKPENMRTPPVQQCLARLLGLRFVEIQTHQGDFPVLDAQQLLPHLTNV